MKRTPFLPVAIFSLFLLGLLAHLEGGQISRAYPNNKFIKLTTILGSCKIIQSKDDTIRIDVQYTFGDDEYHAVFSERRDSLILEEEFPEKSPIGVSSWTIAIPEDSRMFISSATGNISIHGVHSELKAETGTGSVEVDKSTGVFELNSGTGSVRGTDLMINGGSRFTSGTGRVTIVIARSSEYDITVASGMSDAILNYNGNPLQGRYEFVAKQGLGRIISPVEFEKEEVKSDEHFYYDRKIFKVDGRDAPRIRIETGNGVAKLVK